MPNYEGDMLGSARAKRGLPGRRLVEPGGSVQAGQTTPCFDADFLPYGQEVDYTSTCGSNYKFEGKERDLETGNDDFGARYYRSALGRWLSADWSSVPAPVPYANLTNPQTLNLYAMVSDNPETFADLDGHICGTVEGSDTVGCTTGPLDLWTPGVPSEAQKTGDGTKPSTTQRAQQQGLQNEQLKYKTVSGGQHTNPWEIKWSLTHNTKKGGWIVQHIVADFKGSGHYNYWEAWPVAPNSHVPSTHGVDVNGTSYSDMFSGRAGSHIHASARFYEGLRLPNSFKAQPLGFPAGILRATTTNPHLPTQNATAPNVRWWGDQQ